MESIPQDMGVQKNIFQGFQQVYILRNAALSFIFLCIAILPVDAGSVLHYKTYHPQTGEITNRFYYSIEENLSGEYQVHWVIDEDGSRTEEDYVLDEQFETLRFRVVNVDDRTDYIGEQRENSIFIRGQFKGEKIERTGMIDERPFYYNPKLGLTAFVRSGKREGKFWGFQNKELKAYPMRATNKGSEVISVNGREVEAIKVYWTVDDFRSVFFKRTYWFRKSDGLYVKQKTNGGKFRELVSEDKGGNNDQ